MLDANKPLLITDGLAKELEEIDPGCPNVIILEVKGDPHSVLGIPQDALKKIRDLMLEPFNISLEVPVRTAFYLISDEYIILENFNNEPVDFDLKIKELSNIEVALVITGKQEVKLNLTNKISATIPGRTLLVLRI